MTKEEFVAAADGVCRESAKKIGDLETQLQELFMSDDPDAWNDMKSLVNKAADTLRDGLTSIDYDGEGSEDMETYLATFDDSIAQFELAGETLRSGDWSGLDAINAESKKLNAKMDELARSMGLKDCVFMD